MLAEAFRGKGERMPLGGLAIIGLVGAGAASVLLWNRNADSFGVVTADNFGLFVNLVHRHRRHPHRGRLVADDRA